MELYWCNIESYYINNWTQFNWLGSWAVGLISEVNMAKTPHVVELLSNKDIEKHDIKKSKLSEPNKRRKKKVPQWNLMYHFNP